MQVFGAVGFVYSRSDMWFLRVACGIQQLDGRVVFLEGFKEPKQTEIETLQGIG